MCGCDSAKLNMLCAFTAAFALIMLRSQFSFDIHVVVHVYNDSHA